MPRCIFFQFLKHTVSCQWKMKIGDLLGKTKFLSTKCNPICILYMYTIHMYIWIYICICMYIHICVYTYTYICVFTYTHICIYTYMHIYMHMYIYVCSIYQENIVSSHVFWIMKPLWDKTIIGILAWFLEKHEQNFYKMLPSNNLQSFGYYLIRK